MEERRQSYSVSLVRIWADPDEDGVELADVNCPVWRIPLSTFKSNLSVSFDANDAYQSQGLDPEEAVRRFTADGPNELTPPKELPEWLKYLRSFLDPFMLMLLVAGVLSLVAWGIDKSQPMNLYVGVALFIVVWASCTFHYIQEGQASEVMRSFRTMLPSNTIVLRGGRQLSIPA